MHLTAPCQEAVRSRCRQRRTRGASRQGSPHVPFARGPEAGSVGFIRDLRLQGLGARACLEWS